MIFGCGYIGSEVARQAAELGLLVTALTRNSAKGAALQSAGIDVVSADLAGDSWHNSIRGDVDYVLNCVSSGGGGVDGYRRSYVGGMASILTWAKKNKNVGTMVYTGSTSVYPQGGGVRVDELASTSNASERGKILLEAEALLTANGGAVARWFILRLAGIYGPGRHALLDQVSSGTATGREEHRLNLVHRDDVCAAIWLALFAPPAVKNEVFNMADDGGATKKEVIDWLAAERGLPPPKFTGEPVKGRRGETADRVIASDKLRAALGWRPAYRTFREGYQKILSR